MPLSTEEMNEDWENCCPLCMEEMDSTDRQLKPCRCGYQICVWCWNHIMEMAEKDSTEGRCPACRTPYDKEKIVSTAVRLSEISDKKQKPGKVKKTAEGRKNLSNVRVIQRNLVYVVGIPAALADEETLERREYFGQYGKILKISVSKSGGHSSQHSSVMPSVSVYVTFVKEEDALRCIQSVNGYVLDGKMLKACFGTTKYCNAWLKSMPCNNPDCLYLHDEGTREDSFTKEEMLAKYGSKNQHFHDLTHPLQRRSGVGLPPPVDTPVSSTSGPPQNVMLNAPYFVESAPKAVPLVAVNLPKSSSLPAAASWGSCPSPARPASGRTGGYPATIPKTSAGLIDLVTVSGNSTSGQSVGNHEGIKHAKTSNTDGAHTSLSGVSRPAERNHPAAETSVMIRTETFPSDAVAVTAGSAESLRSADMKGRGFGTTKDAKIIETACSHKFADAEELSATANTFTCEGLTRMATAQDACLSRLGLLTPMPVEANFTNHEDGSAESCGSFNSSSVDCNSLEGLYGDSETFPQNLEHALQQEGSENHELRSTSDATVSPPVNINGLNIVLRPDHSSCEAHEDVSFNTPSVDTWLSSVHSANSDEPTCYSECETAVQSEDSLPTQTSTEDGSDSLRKAPINGLSENELISDMFSRGFDHWMDRNPQDLAQFTLDGKNAVFPSTSALQELRTTWKSSSGSKQSRFHFARQDKIIDQNICSNKSNLVSVHDEQLWSEKQNKPQSGNVPAGFIEVSVGTSSHIMSSKSPMMAPPGFSTVRAPTVPPPGFSKLKATNLRKSCGVSQDHPRILTPTIGLNHFEATNNSADVELIDPAIMAVGKGKLTASSATTVPCANSHLSALVSQPVSLLQQPKQTRHFEPSYQAYHDLYRNYGHSNRDLDASSSSLFHSSFNDAASQSRLIGQNHDGLLPHVVMQASVYTNAGPGAQKQRIPYSLSDDWNRLSEVNISGQASVNDTVGRLAVSQLSLDILQNRLEELSLTKDLSSKYYGDAAIPAGYDSQGPLNSARIGLYF